MFREIYLQSCVFYKIKTTFYKINFKLIQLLYYYLYFISAESVSPPGSPERDWRRRDIPICLSVHDYEGEGGYRRDIPNRRFLIVIEGEYIIGALIDDFILSPFLADVNEILMRIKIHKRTFEYVGIPEYVSQPDPLNREFYHQYRNYGNMYIAEPPNFRPNHSTCLGFVFNLIRKYKEGMKIFD